VEYTLNRAFDQELPPVFFEGLDEAKAIIDAKASAHTQALVPCTAAESAPDAVGWSEPKQLPPELSPVDPFDHAFLPAEVADWVMDISDRTQCPPDFVTVSVISALGATIGR
jgi:putative DNA primase/helicase